MNLTPNNNSGSDSRSTPDRSAALRLFHGDERSKRSVIRVLLADDHSLVRTTLAAWLHSCGDFEIVAEAADSASTVDLAIKHRPDIVLLDIDMPGLLAFEAAKTISVKAHKVKIVFLSGFSHDSFISQALKVHACGYLSKDQSPQTIAEALRTVAGGGVVFSPQVQARLTIDSDGVRLSDPTASKLTRLKTSELDIIRLLASGMSTREVAKHMHLSLKTIENYCATAMEKLDIHTRVELTRFAIREGIARP